MSMTLLPNRVPAPVSARLLLIQAPVCVSVHVLSLSVLGKDLVQNFTPGLVFLSGGFHGVKNLCQVFTPSESFTQKLFSRVMIFSPFFTHPILLHEIGAKFCFG